MSRFFKADFLLLITAFIWGITFIPQKTASLKIDPMLFTGSRFLLGGVVLFLVWFAKNLLYSRQNTDSSWKLAVFSGCVLAIASMLQQTSLEGISVSQVGFITTLYVIIVPLLYAVVGYHISRKLWICVAICLVGIFVIHYDGSWSDIGFGWAYAALYLSVVGWSLQIIIAKKVRSQSDLLLFCLLQNLTCGVLAMVCFFIFGDISSISSVSAASSEILFTGVFSVGFAFFLQLVGQRNTSATHAVLIFSLESLFATIAAYFLLGETITMREAIGFSLITGAILFSQVARV